MQEFKKLLEKWKIEKNSYIPNANIYSLFINELEKVIALEEINQGNKILTNIQLQTILDVSKRTLQNWRDNGRISYSQIHGKIYYRMNDVYDFLDKHKIHATKCDNEK